MEICRQHDAPVLSRGAGTSLAGQGCNTAVILDFTKHLHHILELDPTGRTAWVEPGVILDSLRRDAERHGLTFGPDPASHSRCTLGGMIGNNSCGVHAVAWGKTVDNVERLDIVTYEGLRLEVGATTEAELEEILRAGGPQGEVYAKLKALRDRYAKLIRERYPKIPRRVSGYNLDELLPEKGFHVARALVGSEGTCVTTLRAKLRLVESPRARQLLVLGYPTVYDAAGAVPHILQYKPLGLEGFDFEMTDGLRRYQGYEAKISQLPPGRAWLLVEFGAKEPAEAKAFAGRLLHSTHGALSSLLCTPAEAADLWRIRESALAATAFIPGSRDRYEGWEDAAVPPEQLASYLRKLRDLYNEHGYRGAFYGHFGDGCVHTRIDFDLDSGDGIRDFRRFLDEATDLVVAHGGSISGEHGDGQARAELLPKMFGPELIQALEEFKAIWDPRDRMNPGKMVRPKAIIDDLRYGLSYKPTPVSTHFAYPGDQSSFARASLRCVGVGQCRREEGGLMCPSYQATREEKHSTRGRAHLLFEMLKGETLTQGWKSPEVKDALDDCLSCKGCKSDCPTNVDMASYKAEFLAHYYQGRLRPRTAYTLGWAHQWLKLGSHMPRVANLVAQAPGFQQLLKWAAGISPERKIPQLAITSFTHWFQERSKPSFRRKPESMDPGLWHAGMTSTPPARSDTVVLWPDTFMNYLEPGIGQSAVQALERLGLQVKLPKPGLCCGRPLYDHGFLDQAKSQLVKILKALKTEIEAGTPVIFLEPGCASVFRDELLNFFPKDPLAIQLSRQSFLLSEFLLKKGLLPSPLPRPPSSAPLVLQTHCHHKSVLTGDTDRLLLERLGYRVEEPESGCCGMAGAFGFEKSHRELSLRIGERALLPSLRKAGPAARVVASGFSCREQIRQATGLLPQHPAEVLFETLHSQA